MEITDSNFISSIALVKKSIETADFIAMDTEFSGTLPRIFVLMWFIGYTATLEDKGHDYDDVEERY